MTKLLALIDEFEREATIRHEIWRSDLISKGYSKEDIQQEGIKAMRRLRTGTYPENEIHSLKFTLTPKGKLSALNLLPELRIIP